MRDSVYLGDLGGLSAHRQLIMLDHRGTGRSAVPEDPSSYRCDRLVDDVEALREHLELAQMNLLGHSAGSDLAVLYAARHPGRVSKLALITPSTNAVGITLTAETLRGDAHLRKDEPWYAGAFAALNAFLDSEGQDADWAAMAPFFCGRWDAAAQAHHAATNHQLNAEAAKIFHSEGAFAPEATRSALAAFATPVLVLVGELDLGTSLAAGFAALLPNSTLVVQRGAGHSPWLDDANQFTATIAAFLGQRLAGPVSSAAPTGPSSLPAPGACGTAPASGNVTP
jgi:proline iminopeptidase